MAKRFFQSAPLDRKTPARRLPKPIILIVCEGKVTEPKYFLDFKDRKGNGLVAVKSIGGCGVPISVVERAAAEKFDLARQARKSPDSFDAHYEVWAVFDRDAHPAGQVPQALELAKTTGVQVAYSNPCFELWVLMHFGCYGKPGHHHETQDALKKAMPSYCHRKNPIFDMSELDRRYDEAVRNAKQALHLRAAEHAPMGDPSTTVHELTERIRIFGRASKDSP